MVFCVNEQKWEIKELPSNDSMLLVGESRCQGVTHFFHQLICIDKDLKADRKKQVLLHELSHCFLYATQIHEGDNFSEEQLCEFIGKYGNRLNDISNEYFGG